MKTQRIVNLLTAINIIALIITFTKLNPVSAESRENTTGILRGNGLEITDSTGKIRASITFQPPAEIDGIKYPGGVLFRLTDSKDQGGVKIQASSEGGGISLSNETNGYIQIISKQSGGFIRIKNTGGKEMVVKP